MTDVLTKKQRSYNMSRIRSKWTKPEVAVHNALKAYGIGHKMHPKIAGSPDVIIQKYKTAIFINGCFWHRCPKHYRQPESNVAFWRKKAEDNVRRDRRNIAALRRSGWKVITIWEHDLPRNSMKAAAALLIKTRVKPLLNKRH
jgi:DNA mismatch endonuclease (patch repair protein)